VRLSHSITGRDRRIAAPSQAIQLACRPVPEGRWITTGCEALHATLFEKAFRDCDALQARSKLTASRRRTLKLGVDLVWLAYKSAAASGRADDPTWFRFPMPGRATRNKSKGPKPTHRALHHQFLNHRRSASKKPAR
jgi:hypothetical protein